MTRKGRVKSIFPWFAAGGLALIVVASIVIAVISMQDADVSVLNPKGAVAEAERDLFWFTLSLSAFVVIPVFTMLAVFAWRYRENNKRAKYTPDASHNIWIETLWWGIPILIIAILSIVTWISTHQLDPYKPLASNEKPIKIQVIAMQWKWLFLYPEQEVASINVLKIPVGIPINFEVTADAPMSTFWIPSLGTQIYAMNGMSARLSLIANEPGVYRGSNSNISGEGYADMSFNVETLPDRQAFERWAAMVRDQSNHNHMDMGTYEKLARPSKADPPSYLHLHDTGLYAKVIDKYMQHEGGKTGELGGHGH